MSYSNRSIKEAKSFLSTELPLRSIVMVTMRSLRSLICVRPYIIDENACLEMLELKEKEVKSLFVKV